MRSRDGAVLVWFGVTAIPLLLAVGVGIDIGRAYAVKVRLGAAVDDAGLAVATTLDPTIDPNTRLSKYFYGNFASTQIGTATAVSYVNDATVTNAIDVTGTATVPTTFMALAGFNSITVQATAQIIRKAPNIDFYLLLDSSPSMGIAATQAAINTLISNTQSQCDAPPAGNSKCGCAFACHETNPAGEQHCNASNCTQSRRRGQLRTGAKSQPYAQDRPGSAGGSEPDDHGDEHRGGEPCDLSDGGLHLRRRLQYHSDADQQPRYGEYQRGKHPTARGVSKQPAGLRNQ
jgi:Flp pilus assembly protein TadG